MRRDLLAGLCGLVLLIATATGFGQESTTSDKKDKKAAEKMADKAKAVGREVGAKAEDVGDKSKKGAKSAGSEIIRTRLRK